MQLERAASLRNANALDRVLTVSESGRFYYVGSMADESKSFATSKSKGRDPIFVDDISLGIEMEKKEAQKLPLIDYMRVAGICIAFDDLTKCDEKYAKFHDHWSVDGCLARAKATALIVGGSRLRYSRGGWTTTAA